MDSDAVKAAVEAAADSTERKIGELQAALPEAIADGMTRVTVLADIARLLEDLVASVDALAELLRGGE